VIFSAHAACVASKICLEKSQKLHRNILTHLGQDQAKMPALFTKGAREI